VNDTSASSNSQQQIPWSDDAERELDEAIERAWRAQQGAKLNGVGTMPVDAMVMPRVRRRRGAKPKLSPELIKEAQEDLLAWGRPLRPFAQALQHTANFLKRKGHTADKRQFKTYVRRVIIPLLSEEQKPKKRQPRKAKTA
jgi:hypothetical protein